MQPCLLLLFISMIGPQSFFFNASSLQVQAVGMGIMGSYDHLTPIYISFFSFVRYQNMTSCYISIIWLP